MLGKLRSIGDKKMGEEMAQLVWERDPDTVEGETEFVGKSGQVVLGSVRKSNRSDDRWRWEICLMPGLGARREDRSGWVASEAEAKKCVQDMWNGWLEAADMAAD